MVIRVLRHYLHVSVVVLGAVEALILFAAAYLAVTTGLGHPFHAAPDAETFAPVFPKVFVFTVAMLCTIAAFGCYEQESQSPNWNYYARCVRSFAAGALVVALIFYAFPSLSVEHDALAMALLLGFGGHVMARTVLIKLLDAPTWKRRVLVLGTGNEAARVCELQRRQNCTDGFEIVGYVPLGEPPYSVNRSLILSECESLHAIVHKHRVDEIVIALDDRRLGNMPLSDLVENKINGTTIMDTATFFERETGRVRLESINPSWLIFSDGFQVGPWHKTVKRFFDVFVSSALLLITLPIMVVTAIAIGLESSGPIFYRQQRVGEHGKLFELLKFRSMHENAEPDGNPRWAMLNDARCTAIGRVIRRLRIDELPQLANVLLGDMSFVGPRPERAVFVAQLARQIPYYSYRHSVKPGVTGWAQVRYRYGASIEDAKAKLEYDLYYVKNHSLFLDLLILIRTIRTVLFAEGAR